MARRQHALLRRGPIAVAVAPIAPAGSGKAARRDFNGRSRPPDAKRTLPQHGLAVTPDQWTPGRIADRFNAIDRRLADVEIDVKTRADAGAVIRELENLREELRELQHEAANRLAAAEQLARDAERTANNTANDVIRAGRAENLKLIGIVTGAFTALATAIIGLFATGRVG